MGAKNTHSFLSLSVAVNCKAVMQMENEKQHWRYTRNTVQTRDSKDRVAQDVGSRGVHGRDACARRPREKSAATSAATALPAVPCVCSKSETCSRAQLAASTPASCAASSSVAACQRATERASSSGAGGLSHAASVRLRRSPEMSRASCTPPTRRSARSISVARQVE